MITIDFDRIHIPEGSLVLDVGCGSGRHLCATAAFPNVHVVGLDPSLTDLDEATKRFAIHKKIDHGGGFFELICGDITHLPFEDHFFDLIICSEVLEHIPHHYHAMAEMVRVLKNGGDLIVSVPRFLPEKVCWWLSKDYRFSSGGHIRIFKHSELIKLLQWAHMHLSSYHYAHSLHTPYWWLKCAIEPRMNDNPMVKWYHQFLVWDMMKKPWATRFLDRLFNPLIGKSVVYYAKKR